MGSLASLSDIVNRTTSGIGTQAGGNIPSGVPGNPQYVTYHKLDRVIFTGAGGGLFAVHSGPALPVAGRITSLWQYCGTPSHGYIPTGASIANSSTIGSISQLITIASGSTQTWLLGAMGGALATGTFVLYDRLCHTGGLNGTLTGQAVNTPTLTRQTGGVGNRIMLEIYSAIGATGTTVYATYTNQNGVSGQTTTQTTIGGAGFSESQRLMILPLAIGDTGVQSVQTVTLLATTGTVGNFGVTIIDPIVQIPAPQLGYAFRDLIMGCPAIQPITPQACLAMYFIAGGAVIPEVTLVLNFVDA